VDLTSLDDEALLRLIIQRNQEALGVIYDRYSRLVFSMALHAVGDRLAAEEITQDVFLRVWEKAGTYRSEAAKVSTWLASIARYRSIDYLRRRGVRLDHSSIGWEDLTPGSMPVTDNEPEDYVEQESEHWRIRRAITHLPEEQRLVLDLAYFFGLSHSEISNHLGEPLGTVKTRIRLAMQKLREALKNDLPVEK
jgi:RNA polymerase sigma-70 factor (ECF subfamily)